MLLSLMISVKETSLRLRLSSALPSMSHPPSGPSRPEFAVAETNIVAARCGEDAPLLVYIE